jgi:hypothetical protein
MTTMLRSGCAAALVAVLAACAPARVAPEGAAGQAAMQAAADVDRELVVRVQNDLVPPTALTVWLQPEAGARRMLGTVEAQAAATFPIDAAADGGYRLVARTAAGAEIASGPFTPLIPGAVRWEVAANAVATTGLDQKRTPAEEPPL